MEALYKKLYDKYSRLKVQKFTEVDRANDELEQLFVEYASAADGFVEQLKLENEKLRASVHDLRKETAILRSAKDEQYDCFQQSLLEEKQKNRQLSVEITRLQKLQEEKQCSSGGIMGTHSEQEEDAYQHTPVHLEDQSTQSGTQITGNKRPRVPESSGATSLSPPRQCRRITKSPSKSSAREQESIYVVDQQLPDCCTSITGISGARPCIFKALLECLIGMKVSVDKNFDMFCISVQHQSTGYTFRLTRVNKDTELLYQVSTLGTFEKVAPDWMKEVMIFNVSMCPLFFERVKRVVQQC